MNRYICTSLLWLGVAASVYAQGTVNSVSAADYVPIVAPDSIASIFGTNLASTEATASAMPLPTTLANVQVSITDSAKNTVSAPLLYVSPSQINFIVPAGVAVGAGTVSVMSGGATSTGTLLVSNVAPAIFTANANGTGAPSAQFTITASDGTQTFVNAFGGTAGNYTTQPVSVTSGAVYLSLYTTGVRNHSANPLIAMVNGVSVPIAFVGAQSQFAGLDQVNIGPLPASLAGTGQTNLVLIVDGIPANTVQIAIQ